MDFYYKDIPLSQRRRAVRDAIKYLGPKHFDMANWITTKPSFFTKKRKWALRSVGSLNINSCGTTGCIAGHTAFVASGMYKTVWNERGAAQFLGIQHLVYIGNLGPFSPGYPRWEQYGHNHKAVYQEVLVWLNELVEEAEKVESETAQAVQGLEIPWYPSWDLVDVS